MSEREAFLRRFHADRPGITPAAFAGGGSYERLASRVPTGRVLDLGCGDGHLARLIGDRCVGVDPSREELESGRLAEPLGGGVRPELRSGWRAVRARAQALPFADGAFDSAVAHLSFMLFDDLDRVVAELARVVRPGGRFVAVLGGGPTAGGDDAFHRFLAIARPHLRDRGLGDRRARTEPGWRSLFAGWTELAFERHELDLGGSFDDVWRFLGSSYELPPSAAAEVRAALRATFAPGHVPCRAVTWLASVRTPDGGRGVRR